MSETGNPSMRSTDRQTNRTCVVLVHGYANTHRSMEDLARDLMQQGYAVVNWCYASMAQDITASAEQLHQIYDMNAPYYDQVHLVTHSMGGLVVRRLLALTALEKLGAIVMIAPPNNGARIAHRIITHPLLRNIVATPIVRWFFGPAAWEMQDPQHIRATCATPKSRVLVIAGTLPFHACSPLSFIGIWWLRPPHDGTLVLEETFLSESSQVITIPAPHDLIASDTRTVEVVRQFLADGVVVGHPDRWTPKPGHCRRIKSPWNMLGIVARGKPWFGGLPALPPLGFRHRSRSPCWCDCAVVRGWRLQRHILLGCYRVLDPESAERGWGGKTAMMQLFFQQVGGVERAEGATTIARDVETAEASACIASA